MSNAKRFLSVILAIIFVCSTLVVGASAVYTPYKDDAITTYDGNCKPVLTIEQYASAAVDELDRMLSVDGQQLNVYVGTLNLTSVDNTLDSVVTLVNTTFAALGGMVGDLGGDNGLTVKCFDTTKDGVRRKTEGKTDLDILYSVFQFLYDNKGLITRYINGTLNLGSILTPLIPEEYKNVSALLKGIMAKETYGKAEAEKHKDDTLDSMVQKRVTDLLVEELGETQEIIDASQMEGDGRNAYKFIDDALRIVYNIVGVRELNRINFINNVKELCGVKVTENVVENPDGTKTKTYSYDYSEVNGFYNIINVQDGKEFTIPSFNFDSSKIVALQVNDLLGSIVTAVVNCEVLKYTWQTGDNSKLLTNVVNLAKAIIQYDNENDLGLFASYIRRATDAEIAAMSNEELITYILRAIINGSVDGMYIPESATTMREFGFYTLQQLLATSVPECDFTGMPMTTETLVVMGIDFAIYNIEAEIDMGLEYVDDMDGVAAQLSKAAEYGVEHYGGILKGMNLKTTDSGWVTLDKIIFSILNVTWLPTEVQYNEQGQDRGLGEYFKTFLFDVLLDNILDLNVDGLLAKLQDHEGELHSSSAKQLVINTATRIVNIIFPGAIQPSTTIEALATNAALANTVDAIFSDLYLNRASLAKAALPIVCDILDLTSEQQFKYPSFTYESLIGAPSGAANFDIKIRNNCTGINTGYRDASGVFHQDSLYKYNILSITGATKGTDKFTPPESFQQISAGQELTCSCSFTINGDVVLPITIEYEVLTEDGTSLTGSNTISETFYIYFVKNTLENPQTTVTSGSYSATFPKYIYVKSLGELCDVTADVTSLNTASQAIIGVGTQAGSAKKLDPTYITFKENQTTIPSDGTHKTETTVDIFTTTDAYDALPDSSEDPAEITKENVWDKIVDAACTTVPTTGKILTYGKCQYSTFGVNVGGTNVTTTNAIIFPYKDYGLTSMFEKEVKKHRQAGDYNDATAWTAYQTAMNNAANVVLAPNANANFATGSGKASKFEAAATALTNAIEALEACAQGGNFDNVLAIINNYHPANVDDQGNPLEYDDPRYQYFGVADYVPYTYYNYRQEEKAAKNAYESTIDKGDGEEPKVIDSLTVKNYEHRLTMMGDRLLSTTAIKTHLERALANRTPAADESKYTAESWAKYATAVAFAETVMGDTSTDLKQSKVDTAFENLLEYDKRLILAEGPGPGPIDPEKFLPADPENGALPILKTTDESGEEINALAGLAPGVELSTYFDSSICDVVVTPNESGKVSTNAIAEVKDKSGKTIATYVLSYSGDINLDGACGDSFDLPVSARNGSGAIVLKGAAGLAGDLNNDGNADSFDLPVFARAASGAIVIDYYNRCAK